LGVWFIPDNIAGLQPTGYSGTNSSTNPYPMTAFCYAFNDIAFVPRTGLELGGVVVNAQN